MSVSLASLHSELTKIHVAIRVVREIVDNAPHLARKDVLRRYGWSRSTLYRQMRRGFPKPHQGFWTPHDLDAWDANGRPASGLQVAGQQLKLSNGGKSVPLCPGKTVRPGLPV